MCCFLPQTFPCPGGSSTARSPRSLFPQRFPQLGRLLQQGDMHLPHCGPLGFSSLHSTPLSHRLVVVSDRLNGLRALSGPWRMPSPSGPTCLILSATAVTSLSAVMGALSRKVPGVLSWALSPAVMVWALSPTGCCGDIRKPFG